MAAKLFFCGSTGAMSVLSDSMRSCLSLIWRMWLMYRYIRKKSSEEMARPT